MKRRKKEKREPKGRDEEKGAKGHQLPDNAYARMMHPGHEPGISGSRG